MTTISTRETCPASGLDVGVREGYQRLAELLAG